MINFRTIIRLVAIIVISTSGAIFAQSSKSMIVLSWGGAYTKSQTKAFFEPYSKKTSINISTIVHKENVITKLREYDDKGITPPWHIADVEMADVIKGCEEGLLEPIDHSMLTQAPDGTSVKKDFLPGSLLECGVGNIVWSTIYAYDIDNFPNKKLATIADFFNVKKFPGKRAMRKDLKSTLAFALLADGVKPSDIYYQLSTAQGINRAFKKMDTIKDHIIWWVKDSEPVDLLTSGKVVMATAYSGRIFNAIVNDKKKLQIVWDGQILEIDFWVIPASADDEKKKMAMDFIRYSSETKNMARMSEWISYGPTRRSSVPFETNIPMAPTYQQLPRI